MKKLMMFSVLLMGCLLSVLLPRSFSDETSGLSLNEKQAQTKIEEDDDDFLNKTLITSRVIEKKYLNQVSNEPVPAERTKR